jgi:uncharacterized membrane protein
MKEWFVAATEAAVIVIDVIALVLVVFASLEAFVKVVPAVLSRLSDDVRRDLWLRYARWLVAALTFQLGADIIETSIRTDWQAIARMGAIAAVRTALNYFLDRDIREKRELERERPAGT